MTSGKPYLLRAINEWILDNGMTPHVVVDTAVPGTIVPLQSVQDNRIVLNISATASHGLELSNDLITFTARFSGTPFQIRIPINAILAIYARENGKGMVFQDDERIDEEQANVTVDQPKKPVLTIIK